MMRASALQKLTLAMLVLLSAFVLAPGNTETRPLESHELLVVETASEMLERNEFLVPHIMGEVRLQKPPLSYWLSIAAHLAIGEQGSSRVSELEARLPSLISGLLVILVSYGLGLQLTRDARGGLLAAGLIATSWAFYAYSRSARPEMIYTFLCASIALGFVMATRHSEENRPTLGAAAFAWTAFGLALLAKGPQFPLFILLGAMLTLRLRKSRIPILSTLHPWMIVPAIVPAMAYFTYLDLQVDDATTLWGTELVQGAGVPIWYRPLRFYYPIALFAGIAPWLLLLGATGYDIWKRRELAALLIASCVLVALVLISFSGKLRFHYVLPLMPLCAALIAWSSLRWYDAADKHTVNPRLLRWLVWGQLALVGLLAPVFAYAVMKSNARELTVPPIPWMLVAGGLFLAAALAAKRRSLNWFAAALITAVLFTWGAFSWIGLDTSRQSTTAYRFIKDVAARLPEDSLLYFDSGRPAFFQYYFNRGEIESYTLHRWARDGAAKPLPYFIVESGQIRKAGIQGEVLISQQIADDDAMVLFRPDPANP